MQSSNKKPQQAENKSPEKTSRSQKITKTLSGAYLKRQTYAAMPHTSGAEQKTRDDYAARQLAESAGKFKNIMENIAILFESDSEKEKINPISRKLNELQDLFIEANKSPSSELNNKFIKEAQDIQKSLVSLMHKKIKKDEQAKAPFKLILQNLGELKNHLLLPTQFNDDRIKFAKKIFKKQKGANAGYTITNLAGTTFTVKQGKTVGNTLSEAFSSMVLSRIARVTAGEEDKSKILIANAFLVVYQPGKSDKNLPIEKRCKNNLFAASEWSSGKAFVACHLFGLKKRKKRAGTRQAKDFEDLRKLNAACHLGLENIVAPTTLIADFDLHTENFMLKINEDNVPEHYKKQVSLLLEQLEKSFEKNKNVSREQRLENLTTIIQSLQSMGAVVYFHKIDHDSGFYRYADSKRKVDFSSHRTSPFHFESERMALITQPTLHITEITGGTAQGLEELLLSSQGIDRLLKLSLESELQIIKQTTIEFFALLHEKANILGSNSAEKTAAEFYLLNEFYYHLTEKHQPSTVTIEQLKEKIEQELEKGTRLKVQNLHVQIYKCLAAKKKERDLTNEERAVYTEQLQNMTDYAKKNVLGADQQRALLRTIEELTLKLKKDVLIKHLASLPYVQEAISAEKPKFTLR